MSIVTFEQLINVSAGKKIYGFKTHQCKALNRFTYFMWTLETLQKHITDQIEESLYLDYKAAGSLSKEDKKKTEISKDISAFANSDGGVIIYGMKEFQKDTKYLPESIDPIDRNYFSKETLEDIINSRISPRIHGIVITPITIGEPSENKVVYVVEIPKGNTAFQAYDKRYYRRFNFQSVAMDDWEIKDIINRQSLTEVKITFRPRFNKSFLETYKKQGKSKLLFDIIATNTGRKIIQYIECFITGNGYVADMIIPTPPVTNDRFELIYSNEIERKAKIGDDSFVINVQRMAILPMTFSVVGQIEIYSRFLTEKVGLTVATSTDCKCP